MSKGSARRPSSVDPREFAERWDRIFTTLPARERLGMPWDEVRERLLADPETRAHYLREREESARVLKIVTKKGVAARLGQLGIPKEERA